MASTAPGTVGTETAGINMVADPAPVAAGAFAGATFVLSLINAGVIAAAVEPVALTLALFYGGMLQLLAGMWEFRNNRNTFGAVAFTGYGVFWISLWYLVTQVLSKGAIPAADIPTAVGVFLLVWTIFTFYLWVATFRTNGVLVAIFSALLLTFILLTLGNWGGNPAITKIGGWTGIVTAIFAWYLAAALVINFTFKRAAVPLFPFAARS